MTLRVVYRNNNRYGDSFTAIYGIASDTKDPAPLGHCKTMVFHIAPPEMHVHWPWTIPGLKHSPRKMGNAQLSARSHQLPRIT